MLRDASVLRSSHPRVQEKCLEEDNDLTLAKALEISRNFEVSQTNMKTITEEDTAVKHVKSRKDRRKTRKPIRNKQSKPQNENKDGKCPRCGYQNGHTKANCPARNEKCAKCKKKGHFAKVCRRYSNAHQVQEDENDTESEQSDSDNEYLHQILSITDSKEGSEL